MACTPPLVEAGWTGPDGEPVGDDVVTARTGPGHCDLDDVVFLTLPNEVVDAGPLEEKHVTYVRDPNGDLPDRFVAEAFETLEERPTSAKSLGYRTADAELFSVGEDSQRIIVVFDGEKVESWARETEAYACA